MTASQIKKSYMARNKGATTFNSFTEKLILGFKNANKLGNASVYRQALNFIKNNSTDPVHFKDINYSFLKKLEEVHLSAGFGYNSLSVKMRTIRAIFNKAINEDVAKPEWYPFNKFKINQAVN